MKGKFLVLLILLSSAVSAQLTVTPGADFFVDGNMRLTLENADLINNGKFTAGNSLIRFAGNASSNIAGDQPLQFFELAINKTGNTTVFLQNSVKISGSIIFSSGFLNLNGFDVDLGKTGSLFNEQENSRVLGPNGGQVLFSTILNAPGGIDPGNLGAFFSSTENLGNVIIKRGHQSQSGSGLNNSINRYYDIIPENNITLDEFGINFFNGELNAINQNSLVLYKSEDLINWSNQGSGSRAPNFVKQNSVRPLSRWTLSADDSSLPVDFTLFNAKCESNTVVLTWNTGREQNSSRFDIERSNDGSQWTVIGNVPAAGNSNNEKTYSFTDNSTVQNSFYRIAGYQVNGIVQYTSAIRSSCDLSDKFTVWPNPTPGLVNINIATVLRSAVIIKVFDSKGSLVKIQNAEILPGNNVVKVDLRSVSTGVYSLSANWNNGQIHRTLQVVKLY